MTVAKIGKSKLNGAITPPPSKSISHRAVICAALAQGESRISNLSLCDDVQATLAGVQAMGASVRLKGSDGYISGIKDLRSCVIDCKESASTLRFLAPVCALARGESLLLGRAGLMRRPMGEYERIFSRQGLLWMRERQGIKLGGRLSPGEYILRGDVSSQFISGLMFAMPLLHGDSIIRIIPPVESRSYILMTSRVLRHFGFEVEMNGETEIKIRGWQRGRGCCLTAPADWSLGAVFVVLRALCGDIDVNGLDKNSCQGDKAIETIVKGEKDADLADCPDLGPLLMAFGTFLPKGIRLKNAGRLRYKESDRIEAMICELKKMGGTAEEKGGTVEIERTRLHSARLFSHGDHRIAMALATAALAAGVEAEIEGAEAVSKSYPGFWDDLKGLGAQVELSGV